MTFQLQQKTEAECLSLASDPDGRLLHVLHGFLCLLGLLVDLSGSLLGSGLLLGVLGSSHRLLSLGLPDLGLLVPLGHDVLEGGSDYGSLELLGPLVPFLGNILLQTLLVLPSVEDSPGDLTRITLQKMSLVGSSRQEPGKMSRLLSFLQTSVKFHILQFPHILYSNLSAYNQKCYCKGNKLTKQYHVIIRVNSLNMQ